MRLTILTTGLVAAALTNTAHGWAWCQGGYRAYFSTYSIVASGVDDIPGICGGLWDNLKAFPDCIGVSVASCYKNGDGNLAWAFINGSGCNKGMVESAWWEATRNRFGALNCQLI